MQDCLRLRLEIDAMNSLSYIKGAKAIRSDERLSPLAVVRINGFSLLHSAEQSTIDFDILIPDFYGFGSSASLIICSANPLKRNRDFTERVYPGFVKIDERNSVNNARSFAAMRCHTNNFGGFALFLTPPWTAGGYRHTSLVQFVERVRQYFADPDRFIEGEIDYCWSLLKVNPNPWWLVRIMELYGNLNKSFEASQIRRYGLRRFPTYFASLSAN